MAAVIPLWLVGSQASFAAVLTIQTLNTSTGALTDSTNVYTLTNDTDEFSLDSTPVTEEISAMNATRSHNVLLQESTSVTITEILKKAGANKLAAAASLGTYYKIVATRGAQVWTYYGLRGPYSEGVRKGKSVASQTLLMLDTSETNPAYA